MPFWGDDTFEIIVWDEDGVEMIKENTTDQNVADARYDQITLRTPASKWSKIEVYRNGKLYASGTSLG